MVLYLRASLSLPWMECSFYHELLCNNLRIVKMMRLRVSKISPYFRELGVVDNFDTPITNGTLPSMSSYSEKKIEFHAVSR